MINAAEVNQHYWLEESGQWLENVYRTHLVVALGTQYYKKASIETV